MEESQKINLIIDDGWSYDERKRVTPEIIKDWYRDVADWSVSPAKFPDFDAHVKRVQKMGMKYLLWVATYLIGRQSRFLAEHPACTTSQPLEEAMSGDSAEVTWILNLSDAPIPLKNGSQFFTPEGKPSVPGTIPMAGCGSFKEE